MSGIVDLIKLAFIFGDPPEFGSDSLKKESILQVPGLKGRLKALKVTLSSREHTSQSPTVMSTAFLKHISL
jgi:hypothetical protein